MTAAVTPGRPALAPLARLDATGPAMFRFRQVGDHVLITNQEGRYLLLTPDEFDRFTTGRVEPGGDLFERLRGHNFLRDHYDVRAAADMLRARKRFVHAGPNLHMAVVTLRCNETCVYCHASRANMDAVHTDMTKETAEQTVDFIFKTTSPFVTIEFQGGEPLVNYEVVQHLIEYALQKNKRARKELEFTMVSNLSLMDDAKLEYLIDRKVQLCTSIDGPAALHDKQRVLPTLSAHGEASRWIQRINAAYQAKGLDPTLYHVEALLTTTRATLPQWKEVVDTYVALGCRALFLRPVDPFGFAARTGPRIEYPRAEYLEFYRRAVDYMLALNAQGVEILERYAAIFLTKIMAGVDPNFLDVRWPAGAGLGALAYDHDGSIYTCDEGRMLAAAGDETFKLGHVATAKYRDVVGHETVRAVAIASNLEATPDCVDCTYLPYCGVPPSHSHKTQGTIFGRMRESAICQVHKGIQDYLFEKIAEGDPRTLRTFEQWTTNRPREHFIQE
ncbi:MAG: His-Xaa-Ser system radical SAM maturase HxsB [Kofleriaceae bacterium]|nr:His-Xaa-Ser system radical SAM maturase HxsB [Kofleriaceae bacterium]